MYSLRESRLPPDLSNYPLSTTHCLQCLWNGGNLFYEERFPLPRLLKTNLELECSCFELQKSRGKSQQSNESSNLRIYGDFSQIAAVSIRTTSSLSPAPRHWLARLGRRVASKTRNGAVAPPTSSAWNGHRIPDHGLIPPRQMPNRRAPDQNGHQVFPASHTN